MLWSESWQSPEEWLTGIESSLRADFAAVRRGGCYDSWDLEVRGGAFGSSRVRALIEEHGGGRQLLRLRSYPRVSGAGIVAPALFAFLSLGAALDRSWLASVILTCAATMFVLRTLQECAGAAAEIVQAIEEPRARPVPVSPRLKQATTGRS